MNAHTVIAIKAGDGDAWELDVLGVPFGGPDDGKDADGEYFDAETNLHEDKFGLPAIAYYHGGDDSGEMAESPEYIGRALSSETRPDGVWYRVALDKANELAQRVWDAAQRGVARASSGTVGHLARRGEGGHILEWPVAEMSLFEIDSGKRPANNYAVAVPVLKALGIDLAESRKADLFDVDGHEWTGVTLMAYLPEKVAAELAAMDGVETPADELHITLAYYGDADDLTSNQIANLISGVSNITRWTSPLVGTIGGVGRFAASDSSDGLDVLYANVDVPGLSGLRSELVRDAQWKLRPLMNHDFTPHVTLAYIGTDDEMPITKWEPIDLVIDTISVAVGDMREDFRLGREDELSTAAKAADDIEPTSAEGEIAEPEAGCTPAAAIPDAEGGSTDGRAQALKALSLKLKLMELEVRS